MVHQAQHAAAAKSLQSCPTLSDPKDCSLPGSVHGIFQATVLEWGANANMVGFVDPCYRLYVFVLPKFMSSNPRSQ